MTGGVKKLIVYNLNSNKIEVEKNIEESGLKVRVSPDKKRGWLHLDMIGQPGFTGLSKVNHDQQWFILKYNKKPQKANEFI